MKRTIAAVASLLTASLIGCFDYSQFVCDDRCEPNNGDLSVAKDMESDMIAMADADIKMSPDLSSDDLTIDGSVDALVIEDLSVVADLTADAQGVDLTMDAMNDLSQQDSVASPDLTMDGGIVDLISQDLIPLPTCMDKIKNGQETDVDCGGGCAPCAVGRGCLMDTDCVNGTYCNAMLCALALSSGSLCIRDRQCATTFCVEGICCMDRCNLATSRCFNDAYNCGGKAGSCGVCKLLPGQNCNNNASSCYNGSCYVDTGCACDIQVCKQSGIGDSCMGTDHAPCSCGGGAACNGATQVCVAGACKLKIGQPCMQGAQCASGKCSAGLCSN